MKSFIDGLIGAGLTCAAFNVLAHIWPLAVFNVACVGLLLFGRRAAA